MERDNNLRSLKKARRKCVGLCYILRQITVSRLFNTYREFHFQEEGTDY